MILNMWSISLLASSRDWDVWMMFDSWWFAVDRTIFWDMGNISLSHSKLWRGNL